MEDIIINEEFIISIDNISLFDDEFKRLSKLEEIDEDSKIKLDFMKEYKKIHKDEIKEIKNEIKEIKNAKKELEKQEKEKEKLEKANNMALVNFFLYYFSEFRSFQLHKDIKIVYFSGGYNPIDCRDSILVNFDNSGFSKNVMYLDYIDNNFCNWIKDKQISISIDAINLIRTIKYKMKETSTSGIYFKGLEITDTNYILTCTELNLVDDELEENIIEISIGLEETLPKFIDYADNNNMREIPPEEILSEENRMFTLYYNDDKFIYSPIGTKILLCLKSDIYVKLKSESAKYYFILSSYKNNIRNFKFISVLENVGIVVQSIDLV